MAATELAQRSAMSREPRCRISPGMFQNSLVGPSALQSARDAGKLLRRVRFVERQGAIALVELSNSDTDMRGRSRGVFARWMSGGSACIRVFASHADPLAELSNWVALIIGTHLPFWPLYVLWSAGSQALPSSLLTVAMTPLFLSIPLISRKNGFLGRVAMPVFGNINTVFTIWVLGIGSGTEVFLAPCAALAVVLFRRAERWTMVVLTALPLFLWILMQAYPPPSLHHYDANSERQLVFLNVCSIGVLFLLFGWLQADVYRKMEIESKPKV